MMTDRQRVEAGIVPALIYGTCYNMKDVQETEDQKQKHALVVEAAFNGMLDPVSDLIPTRAGQIMRRSERAYLVLADILDGASNTQAMMAIYYLLEGLLQEGRLTIYEDSSFGQALQVLMQAIDEHWTETKLDAAAQKRARQMREALRKEGYFR